MHNDFSHLKKCHNEPKNSEALQYDSSGVIQYVGSVLESKLEGLQDSYYDCSIETDVKISDKIMSCSNHRIVIDYGNKEPLSCDAHGDVHWMEIGFDGIALVLSAAYIKRRNRFSGRRDRSSGKAIYVPLVQAVMPAMQFKGIKPLHWVDMFIKQAFARIQMARNMMRVYDDYSMPCHSVYLAVAGTTFPAEETHGHYHTPVARSTTFDTRKNGHIVGMLNKLAKQYRQSTKIELSFKLIHRKLEKINDGYIEYNPPRWPMITVECNGGQIGLSLEEKWIVFKNIKPSSEAAVMLHQQSGITHGSNRIYSGETMLSLASRIFWLTTQIRQNGGFSGQNNEQ